MPNTLQLLSSAPGPSVHLIAKMESARYVISITKETPSYLPGEVEPTYESDIPLDCEEAAQVLITSGLSMQYLYDGMKFIPGEVGA